MVDGKLHAGERNHRAIVVIILVCLYQALVDEPASLALEKGNSRSRSGFLCRRLC